MNKLRKALLILFATMTAVFAPSAMNAQTEGNWIDHRDTEWPSDYSQTSFAINTPGQLAQLAYLVNNDGKSFEEKTITLNANIDLADHYWTAIGLDDDSHKFWGTFNGNGYSISNLTINKANGEEYQGLFGYLRSATVTNVNLVNCNITAFRYIGGIAGDATFSTISNCSVGGAITSVGSSPYVSQGNIGGIVGAASGGPTYITGNTNTASITTANGSSNVGGIVGYMYANSFENNFSNGSVTGTSVGSLVGSGSADRISNNCYPAGLGLPGAVTGSDIEGASVGFTISAGDGVTLSLPTPVKTYNNVDYYMSGTVVNTTAFTVPDNNHFTGYTVNSGSISDAGLMNGSHILTGATENVTITATYATGEPTDFSELITITVEDATYNGQAHLQEPVVTMGQTTLTKNVDYAVSYGGECINAGEYTLTVTGICMYTGSKTATFHVLPYNINNDNVQITNVVNMGYDWDPSTYEPIFYVYYTGSDITFNAADVEVAIRGDYDYTYLNSNTDYTISTDPSPVNAIGDYTLNVNGTGNYTGTKSLSFNVVYSAPCDITVTNTPTTATLTWSDENTPIRWEVEYRISDLSIPYNPDNPNLYYPFEIVGIVSSDTRSITLTGLIPESEYKVRVRGIYNDSESQWSYEMPVFETSTKITIGESESGTAYLPTTTDAQYAVSQQIYTAAEIGQAGTIATIEFLSDVWGDPITRNVDVYMVHTNKTAFESNSDWISVSENDKVFSGSVEFYSWTTIILSIPFSYNTSNGNLAIIVHDKTGEAANSTPFGCFDTESNQALFVSGSTDYDLTSMSGVTGTPASIKNQIRLLMPDKIISTDGEWNDANKWTPNGVPTEMDTVFVNANVTIPNGCIAQAFVVSLRNGSLTIKDGGQLICSNAVTATVEKNIAKATHWGAQPEDEADHYTPDGWYFFASPFTNYHVPGNVINMYSGDYDLYRLNPSTMMWENFKNHEADFQLVNGQGYLYANSIGVTLSFIGTTKPYTAGYTVEANSWNLVGNPYTFNAYVNQPHYVLNSAGTAVVPAASNSAAIAPCTGVLVSGNATFYNAPQTQSNNQGNIEIALAQTVATRGGSNMETLDNAIVSFNEGNELSKFYFGTQAANIYIPQGTEEYAIAYSNAQGEMPVNFKANQDGEYTLSINANDAEMSYLHLIDNMTGADIDLLQTPSYTFTAKTSDYESRFRLMFASNGNTDDNNDSFAFFSNGNWIIANEGQATLQVIDINGRILSSESISGSGSKAIDATAGVYMIRLINGNDVKTQKIVIE